MLELNWWYVTCIAFAIYFLGVAVGVATKQSSKDDADAAVAFNVIVGLVYFIIIIITTTLFATEII